jgi:hypothetical protein
MTDHVMYPIPPDYLKRYNVRAQCACVNCGVWEGTFKSNSAFKTCEEFIARHPSYKEGANLDPFQSVRHQMGMGAGTPVASGGNGGTWTTGGAGGGGNVGSQGTTASGMPIRRVIVGGNVPYNQEVPTHKEACAEIDKKLSREDRPGLTPEAIDWEAHKAFGKSL